MKSLSALVSIAPFLLSISFANLNPRANIILRALLRVVFPLLLLLSFIPSLISVPLKTFGLSNQMGLLLIIFSIEFLVKKYLSNKNTYRLSFVEESMVPALICFFVYSIGTLTKENYSYFILGGFLIEYFQRLVRESYKPLNLDIVRLLIGIPFLIYISFIGWESLSFPDILILWTMLNKGAPFSLSNMVDTKEFLVGKKIFIICVILFGLPQVDWTPLTALISIGLSLVMLLFSLFSKTRDRSWQNLKGLLEFLLLIMLISADVKVLSDNILVLAWSEFFLISIYYLSKPRNLQESLLMLVCALLSMGLFLGPVEHLFSSTLIQSTLWGDEFLLIGLFLIYWMGFIAYSYNWVRLAPKAPVNRKISHLEYLYLPSVIIMGLILSI